MRSKPHLSFWQIWNMCFGFLGIQIGFALQNSHVSRIFQTLGAKLDDIPILWIAAPLTGLLVQPIIGYFSDRTWGRFGRRRPYFMAGALLATLALFAMPHAPWLSSALPNWKLYWSAAVLLWILDASINVAMEPFRALIGDQLSPAQRPAGYSMQSFFIGIGAVGGSLPYFLEQAGVANTALPGAIPDTVRYAFYLGGTIFLGAMAWTIFTTKEYPPEVAAQFEDAIASGPAHLEKAVTKVSPFALVGLMLGVALGFAVQHYQMEKELYVLAGLLVGLGGAMCIAPLLREDSMLYNIVSDMHQMPIAMGRLAGVQFFSWFALFSMWIYTTSAVTQVHFGATDTVGAAFNSGANWVGVLFAAYNGFAALAATVIPGMQRRLGSCKTHLVNLWLGGAALLSFTVIKDPNWLMLPMVGIGFAWASILSIPYALLANHVPAHKMGTYMGIFNFFIVIPQLVAASLLGVMLKWFFHDQPIYALVIGGVSFIIAGLLALLVPENRDV